MAQRIFSQIQQAPGPNFRKGVKSLEIAFIYFHIVVLYAFGVWGSSPPLFAKSLTNFKQTGKVQLLRRLYDKQLIVLLNNFHILLSIVTHMQRHFTQIIENLMSKY